MPIALTQAGVGLRPLGSGRGIMFDVGERSEGTVDVPMAVLRARGALLSPSLLRAGIRPLAYTSLARYPGFNVGLPSITLINDGDVLEVRTRWLAGLCAGSWRVAKADITRVAVTRPGSKLTPAWALVLEGRRQDRAILWTNEFAGAQAAAALRRTDVNVEEGLTMTYDRDIVELP